jgi:hypothetical protein
MANVLHNLRFLKNVCTSLVDISRKIYSNLYIHITEEQIQPSNFINSVIFIFTG